jgi:FkbM family methyltransferase
MKQKIKYFIKDLFIPKSFKRLLHETIDIGKDSILLFEKKFEYHLGVAFYHTYNEIFVDGIYQFPSKNETPTIIDCGANMGLSVLYFSKLFPEANIIAFEPDESVLPFLENNIKNYNLSNVKLFKNAVWTEETDLKFYTDNGMGGRVGNEYKEQNFKIIKALRLKDFLKSKVDFLKIDIEGAEFEVLKDCQESLINVENIFVEYHSDINGEQHLDDILKILKINGFRYHLKESFSRKSPFIDNQIVCERFDLAINIFAVKQ